MVEFQAHRKQVESLAFSPDNARLATAGEADGVLLWEAPFARPWWHLIACGPSPQLTFSPDGRWLACAGYGAWVWSIADRNQAFATRTDRMSRCAFSPDGLTFAVQGRESGLRRWHTADWQELPSHWGREVGVNYQQPRPISLCTYHPAGLLALVYFFYDIGYENYVCDIVLHDAESGEERGKIRVAQSQPKLAFSPDGLVLAAVINTQLRVWSVPDCEPLAVRKTGRKHLQDLAFTPDGTRLVTVSNDEKVRLWDTVSWNEVGGFEWKIGKLACVAVSPDGMRMAAGGSSGKVVVWDVD